MQLDRINVAGIACYPNGQISRDANGGILSCQSGAWTSSGKVSAFEMIQGNDACGKYVYSKAYCPAGKQLISGGWVLSNWTGGNGWNAQIPQCHHHQIMHGNLLLEVVLRVERVCAQ